MPAFIIILILIVCLLLALVVLIQNPKGGGLDSTFGSAAQLGGVKKTTDFLEKSTWTLVFTLMVLCLGTAMFTGNNPGDVVDDKYRDAPINQPIPGTIPQGADQAQPQAPATPEQPQN